MNPKDLATEPAARDQDNFATEVTEFFESRLDLLVDQSIEIAKKNGYAPFTTTIRAAWVEAILSVTESLSNYLNTAPNASGPQATLEYKSDPRFASMRQIARQHRSLGITMPMYVGLLKHFRNLYIDELENLPGVASSSMAGRVRDFFDETELSISADWYNSDDNLRLREMQERARAITLDKDRYFAVFESLRNPAFLLDKSHNLLNANQAAAEMFLGDAEAGEIIYLRLMRQRKNSLQVVVDKVIEAVQPSDQSIWLNTLDGARCFDVRMRALHDAVQNTAIGHVVLLNDVTIHRRATEQAQQSERGMSRFLAAMSHEIRTPLHSVLGATELLRASDQNTGDKYLDLIENAGQTLLQTLNNVLDYSKFANDPPQPHPSVVSLSSAIEKFTRITRVAPDREKAQLRFNIAPGLPEHVRIDWAMVQQVLSNLIANAIRADDGQGVSISIQRCGNDAPALRFEVSDHGPGIPIEAAEALLKPFETTNARDTGSGGAGLGLAIAHHLVEAMGGRIGYLNRNVGALVWFETPFDTCDLPFPENSALGAMPEARAQVSDNCLLVDDDPIGNTVTKHQLERLGFDVTSVGSVAEAQAQVQEKTFDILVVDYSLPDGDGPSLVRHLRSFLPERARYIALTANVEALDRGANLGHLFDEILAKPVDQSTLAKALNANVPPVASSGGAQQITSHRPNLEGLSGETIRAMAMTFQEAWESFREAINAVAHDDPAIDLADEAHRLAGSSAVLGIIELEAPLRELERRWHDHRCKAELAPLLKSLDRELSEINSWAAIHKLTGQS